MKSRLKIFLHLLKDKDDFNAGLRECGARSTQLLAPSSLTCLHLPFLAVSPSVCHSSDVRWDNNSRQRPPTLPFSPELYQIV